MLCLAMSNREMATELGIQTRTVKNYLHQMYREYGINSGVRRVKLAVLLFRKRLEREGMKALRDHEVAVEAHMVGGDGRGLVGRWRGRMKNDAIFKEVCSKHGHHYALFNLNPKSESNPGIIICIHCGDKVEDEQSKS